MLLFVIIMVVVVVVVLYSFLSFRCAHKNDKEIGSMGGVAERGRARGMQFAVCVEICDNFTILIEWAWLA